MKAINRTKEEFFEEVKGASYELPEGWKWVKLEDIVDLKYGKGLSEKQRVKGDIPVFGSNGIVGYHNKPLVDFPTIIVGRKGSAGKVNIAKEPCWVIDTAFYIVIKGERLHLDYLYYYLKIIEKKLTFPKGVKPGISKKEYLNNLIPLPFKDGKPDLEKQKQIVEKIEVLFKKIDKAIKLRQKAIEETRKLFDSVLDKIFREAEKDKKNWKWLKLKDMLASLESGKRPKGGAVENGIPSIGGEHLNSDGGFNFHKMKYIPEDFYKTLKKGKIQISDILVVKDGATTGKVSFVSEEFPYKEAAVNEHIFILRIKNDYIPKYVFWFLFSPSGQKEILKNFGGAAQGGINRKFVENVDIPIPITKNGKLDLQKQRQIAEYLDSIHNKIKRLTVLQSTQLEKFGQLKESILNKAFRGELL